MSVITVDTRSRKPIYEQLVDNITSLILHGAIKPGEQLPGVRSLAVELAINPNTIAKAYVELERRGTIYTLSGRGSFVADDITALTKKSREEALAAVEAAAREAISAGVDMAELLLIVERTGKEKND